MGLGQGETGKEERKTTLVRTLPRLREELQSLRRSSSRLGFVPTMGALHAGHGRLMAEARRECETVVVSIFVNPLQFGPREDFARYPRDLDSDLEFCRRHQIDLVFAPATEDLYPQPPLAFVEVEKISEPLCGRSRPGHFRGVATVVAKLFHLIEPDRAYFGEKDAQQLAVIRRMVQDLNMKVQIVAVATVREADGLAVSSRNRYLDPDQRGIAPRLYRSLQAAARAVERGVTDAAEVRQAALAVLEQEPRLRVEYVEVVEPEEMQPVAQIRGPVRIAAAVWVGSTRLIDNVLCPGP